MRYIYYYLRVNPVPPSVTALAAVGFGPDAVTEVCARNRALYAIHRLIILFELVYVHIYV